MFFVSVHVQKTSFTSFRCFPCLHLQIQPEILWKLTYQVEKRNDAFGES